MFLNINKYNHQQQQEPAHRWEPLKVINCHHDYSSKNVIFHIINSMPPPLTRRRSFVIQIFTRAEKQPAVDGGNDKRIYGYIFPV